MAGLVLSQLGDTLALPGPPDPTPHLHGTRETHRAVPDLMSSDNIFERLLRLAVSEAREPAVALFFSALAAGLVITLSFAGATLIASITGADQTLATAALYPTGFVAIVLGRYQLYTENTLTPVALVLTRQGTLATVGRVWVIVLAGNLLGAGLGGLAMSSTGLLDDATMKAAGEVAHHAIDHTPLQAFWRAILAGWLVASMTWIVIGTRNATARLIIIWLFMYLVSAFGLVHCIAGTAEVVFALAQGQTSVWHGIMGYLLPAIAGNTIGGVVLVAILNFAQTHERWFDDQEPLSWRQVLFGGVVRPSLKE